MYLIIFFLSQIAGDSGYSSLELSPSITPVELQSIIGTDSQPLVIDIRSGLEYDKSSIKRDSLDVMNLPAEHIQAGSVVIRNINSCF